MQADEERERLRRTFDRAADTYDRVRPDYPDELFDDLIADKKYQFVYSFTPVPIVGGTGSPGVPIGIT